MLFYLVFKSCLLGFCSNLHLIKFVAIFVYGFYLFLFVDVSLQENHCQETS